MIVAGFGFRRAATAGSLADALRAAQLAAGATAGALATVDRKASALAPMASRAGMGLIAVPEAELRRQVTATQSGASRGSYGTGSVAEAAALAAAGPGARLLAPRSVSDDRLATCALAKSRAEPEGGA